MGSNPPIANTFHTKYKYLLLPHAGDTETQTKCLQKGEKSERGSGVDSIAYEYCKETTHTVQKVKARKK